MIKPTKNFRISKQTKRTMATITDANMRNAYKQVAIQAQLESELAPVRDKKDK